MSSKNDPENKDLYLPPVDSPGVDVKLLGNLNFHLGNIAKHIDAENINADRQRQEELLRLPKPRTFWKQAVPSGFFSLTNFGGPNLGRLWRIRQLLASGHLYEFGVPAPGQGVSAFANAAAGATASVSLPTSGNLPALAPRLYSVTGIDLTGSPSTAAGFVTLTLSGVAGIGLAANLQWVVPYSAASGASFSRTFNPPLLVSGTPTLSVSATPAGSTSTDITLYGSAVSNLGTVVWYVGTPPILANNGYVGGETPTSQMIWRQSIIPATDTLIDETFYVRPNENLWAVTMGTQDAVDIGCRVMDELDSAAHQQVILG